MTELNYIIDNFDEFRDIKHILQSICNQTLKDCKTIQKHSPYDCKVQEAYTRKKVYELIKLIY